MKTLYLECNMGAAGDMLMAALYELLPEPVRAEFLNTMNGLLPGVRVLARPAKTCGVSGTHMEVLIDGEQEESIDLPSGAIHGHDHDHEHDHDHGHGHDHEHDRGHAHSHARPADVRALIEELPLPDPVRQDAAAVYDLIAQAESHVHGAPVDQVHFHEVGALDAVADVAGVCLALHLLAPESIQISPVHVGSGQVRCAHGILPVPVPAVTELLRGIPSYSGEIRGELCTPTGAALLRRFGQSFGPAPAMTTDAVGYGIGKKEFPAANCVRAFWGESQGVTRSRIIELCCHIDDMTAEALAFASERLLAQGALDVSSTPLTMKKGRAGILYLVLCRAEDEERLAEAVLRETNTNGVRARECRKYILLPSVRTVETTYGPVQVKCADGQSIHHEKPEYESVAAIARERNLPFQKVWEDVLFQIRQQRP